MIQNKQQAKVKFWEKNETLHTEIRARWIKDDGASSNSSNSIIEKYVCGCFLVGMEKPSRPDSSTQKHIKWITKMCWKENVLKNSKRTEDVAYIKIASFFISFLVHALYQSSHDSVSCSRIFSRVNMSHTYILYMNVYLLLLLFLLHDGYQQPPKNKIELIFLPRESHHVKFHDSCDHSHQVIRIEEKKWFETEEREREDEHIYYLRNEICVRVVWMPYIVD